MVLNPYRYKSLRLRERGRGSALRRCHFGPKKWVPTKSEDSNLDKFALGSAAGAFPGGRKLLKGNSPVLRKIVDVTAYRALPFYG